MKLVTVYCEATECKYYENGRCQAEGITINYDQYCEDFETKTEKELE